MLKILLVDDEQFTTEGLISMLDWERFDGRLVGTATSGEDAAKLIDKLLPDVIISDIKMNGMTGIDLAGIIRRKRESMRLILLTAHGEFEYARKALQFGVIDYILKPITREKINHLNELLVKLHVQKEQHRNSYLFAWDNQLKEDLLNALRNKDCDFADQFFQSALFEELMSGEDCNAIGVQLIDYLYQYLSEINVSPKALNHSRNETINAFLDTGGRQHKMDFIITKYYDLITSGTDPAPSHADAITSFALKYIKDHYMDPEFNLSGLAYSMNVSLSHLSTVFKHATGNNLSTYVTELRMERAKTLLSDLHYSITETAQMSGYNDAKYFSKLFKKRTGRTPGEYRNLLIQGGIHGI